MIEGTDWGKEIKSINSALKLKTFPLGIKFLKSKNEIPENIKYRSPKTISTFCQQITTARTYGWTIVVSAQDVVLACSSIFGLAEATEKMKDGSFRNIVWCEKKEDAKKFEDSVFRVPLGKYEAIMLSPQEKGLFEPDVVLFYGNPAQIILIVNALQFENYERVQSSCVGESSCSDSIVQCYLTGKPSIGIPCFGERRYGHAQDDEMVIAVSGPDVKKVSKNLAELSKRGIRYPISYLGTQTNALAGMPESYADAFGYTD